MKRRKGFTLVELLVSTFLFSMMMLMVGLVFQRGQTQTQFAENRMMLQDSLREALYDMGQEVREASPSRVSVTNNGATLTFQIPASVSNSGVITWSGPIIYQVGSNGTQLIRTANNQTSVVANHIQSVNFQTTGAPVARVNYTVVARRTIANGQAISLTSTGEARLRNV